MTLVLYCTLYVVLLMYSTVQYLVDLWTRGSSHGVAAPRSARKHHSRDHPNATFEKRCR